MATIKIPKDWQWVKLGDECEFTQGIQVDVEKQKFEKFENSVQFLRIIDFTQVNEPPRYIENPGERYILNKNEIAMVRYGTVGFVCINKIGAIANNLFKINPSKNIYPKYLINFFNSLLFRSKLETKGATMQALSFGLIKPIPLPLPPLETQQAIVSKIEEIFSELDKGIDDLKTAQQQLKTYRQSVLKWAFEGKLTDEKVKWKNKEFKDCLSFSQGIQVDVKLQNETCNKDQIRFLRIIDFTQGKDAPRYINNPGERYKVNKDDISLVRYGATTGFVCSGLEGVIANNLFKVTPKEEIINRYLYYFLKSSKFQNLISINTKGAAMPAISFGLINNIFLPIPCVEEQNLIVQEIESRLSVADKMEESIVQSLQQAEALRQSILKKAFSGELI